MFVEGRFFSPEDVVRYLSNKAGARHIDQKGTDKHLAPLAPYASADWEEHNAPVVRLPPLYEDLLGIARSLTNLSKSTEVLIRELTRTLNVRKVGPRERARQVDPATGEHIRWLG